MLPTNIALLPPSSNIVAFSRDLSLGFVSPFPYPGGAAEAVKNRAATGLAVGCPETEHAGKKAAEERGWVRKSVLSFSRNV